MGGVTGKGWVTTYFIVFEPRQNVSYKSNNVGCNPFLFLLIVSLTLSFLPFLFLHLVLARKTLCSQVVKGHYHRKLHRITI